MSKHLDAIQAGAVDASNVIGIRKALNADARRRRNYSTSQTAPKLTGAECDAIESALREHEPRVVGALHDTGLKLLQSRRYRTRLAPVAEIVAALDAFRLVRFDELDSGFHRVPVYRACAGARSFLFRNIPWQSGGNGPELV